MEHTWYTHGRRNLRLSTKNSLYLENGTQQTHISLFVKGKDVVRALSNGDISDDLALRELPEITHSLGFYTFLRISEAPEARNFEFCTQIQATSSISHDKLPLNGRARTG